MCALLFYVDLGIGKTTLSNELCVRWASEGYLADMFDVVILIPIRAVQQKSLKLVMVEHVGSLEAYQELESSLGAGCLIILEGLDEMAVKVLNDPFFNSVVEENTLFEEATVMITSRPHVCKNLLFSRKIEIVGFGEVQIKRFVEMSFSNDCSAAETFLKQVKDYPSLYGLCYVPLSLAMVIEIFRCNQKMLPSSLIRLYQLVILMVLHRQVKKDSRQIQSVTTIGSAQEVLFNITTV